jgi:chromosome partitioning protein
MPQTIAVLSQKGGTGKTTTVRTLTDVLRRCGVSTLAVDLDPQGNLSDYFDLPADVQPTIADVLSGRVSAAEAIHEDIIPANLGLAEAELMLGGKMGRELTLKRALAEGLESYDVVLIDCPPSLGLLTVNALSAASRLIVPVQCEYYALEGLAQLLQSVELVRTRLNPRLGVTGVLLTMYDARTHLARDVASEVREHFGPLVFDTVVPRSIRLAEAPSHGVPITRYDSRSAGADAYFRVALEVVERG